MPCAGLRLPEQWNRRTTPGTSFSPIVAPLRSFPRGQDLLRFILSAETLFGDLWKISALFTSVCLFQHTSTTVWSTGKGVNESRFRQVSWSWILDIILGVMRESQHTRHTFATRTSVQANVLKVLPYRLTALLKYDTIECDTPVSLMYWYIRSSISSGVNVHPGWNIISTTCCMGVKHVFLSARRCPSTV